LRVIFHKRLLAIAFCRQALFLFKNLKSGIIKKDEKRLTKDKKLGMI
jgi:hypothetical protein